MAVRPPGRTVPTAAAYAVAHDRHLGTAAPASPASCAATSRAAHERDPAARGVSALEILATWPGVHALLAHRVAHALNEAGVPARAARDRRRSRARSPAIEIHPARARSATGCSSTTASGVVIGETAEIGENVTLYQGVTLGGTGFATGKRHPTVEDNVTIGSGAKLLGPIRIGHGAKIGANAVVIHDVPPNSTVVGNPGHPVRVEGRRPEGPDADWVHLPDPIADALKALSRADRRARARARRAARRASRAAARRRAAAAARARAEPRRRLGRAPDRAARRGARAGAGGARAGAQGTVESAAQALASDPVYVHPDASPKLTDAQAAELRQRITDKGAGPMYVAFLPASATAPFGGSVGAALPALQQRLGRPGTYVLVAGRTFRAGSTDLRAGATAQAANAALSATPATSTRSCTTSPTASATCAPAARPTPAAASPPSSRSRS